MALNKYKIGDLIEPITDTNEKGLYKAKDVVGITVDKRIIPTKANVENTDLSKFIIVTPNDFIYNPRTHGKQIGLGYNNTKNTYIISWNNTAFRIKKDKKTIILSDYLFMFICRSEWDRRACFDSWGSSTEVFTWESLCDMDIELPPIPVQQKFVDIYNAMVANQKAYEAGIEDLKLVCDAYIEELRRNIPCEKIAPYISEIDVRNNKDEFKIVRGVGSEGRFIDSRAKLEGVNLKNYKVVDKKQFAYNPSRINLGSIALSTERCIISPMYITFKADEKKLVPEYLMLWLNRKEFHRSTLFYATGSVRDVFDYKLMEEVKIPIPDKKIQQAIANVYLAYENRRNINVQLKEQISGICPILIKGSLEEGKAM